MRSRYVTNLTNVMDYNFALPNEYFKCGGMKGHWLQMWSSHFKGTIVSDLAAGTRIWLGFQALQIPDGYLD